MRLKKMAGLGNFCAMDEEELTNHIQGSQSNLSDSNHTPTPRKQSEVEQKINQLEATLKVPVLPLFERAGKKEIRLSRGHFGHFFTFMIREMGKTRRAGPSYQ